MKKLLKLLLILILPISINAHSLLLNVFDNEDNTITVEGIFNTGESASGALIQLRYISSEEIIYEKRLSDESELTIKIPKEPYLIILRGGPGHKIVKNGIPPLDGFIKKSSASKEKNKNKNEKLNVDLSSSNAVNISIISAFILLFLTIFISIRNTNKILKEIRKK
ncbi:MAG: hypothetical protein HRT40_02335 [Campylobacteraceae bacterium]|nr:hypothetical protein [Campylobacteraceae bacterium]